MMKTLSMPPQPKEQDNEDLRAIEDLNKSNSTVSRQLMALKTPSYQIKETKQPREIVAKGNSDM